MPRETFILTQDIAAGQIIDSHANPASNLGKLAAKKVIDTIILADRTISGTLTRFDLQLLDQPVATLPTDVGILTSKQHPLFLDNSSSGIDDGSGGNRARGSLSTVPSVTSPVAMTVGLNTGVATVPANFAVGDIVRIQGQGLIGTFLAEVFSVVGPTLTFVDPGTANPRLFIEGASGTYNMERVRRFIMSWVTALGAPFAVPSAMYDVGIIRRAYISDVNSEFGFTITPNEAESPQLPGSGGGSVPPTRLINTTAPLQGGGDLSADRTLSVDDATTLAKGVVQLAGDLAGTAAAPTVPGKAPITRQINTTPPLQGGGDLTADRTLSVDDATTLAKGVVQLAGDLAGTAAAPTVPGLATLVPLTRQINTTPPLQGGGDLTADRTLSVDVNPPADTVVVGTSRQINTTAPLQGGGDLSADRSLTVDTSPPAAPVVVGTPRQINTTAPLQGGGDLSADRTLTVDYATESAPGVVELAQDAEYAPLVVVQGNDSRLHDVRNIFRFSMIHAVGGGA